MAYFFGRERLPLVVLKDERTSRVDHVEIGRRVGVVEAKELTDVFALALLGIPDKGTFGSLLGDLRV